MWQLTVITSVYVLSFIAMLWISVEGPQKDKGVLTNGERISHTCSTLVMVYLSYSVLQEVTTILTAGLMVLNWTNAGAALHRTMMSKTKFFNSRREVTRSTIYSGVMAAGYMTVSYFHYYSGAV